MSLIIAKKKVLITGGGGFIGANLARKLINLNYDINLILRESTNLWRIKDLLTKINIKSVDLLDKEKLTKIIQAINPNFIFHLATYSSYRNQEDVEKMAKINIEGTLNLLMASKDINYDIFINTGSSSEYGVKQKPMKETDTLSPISFYAATKASATFLCKVFTQEYKKPIVTLRPFSVYGPYEGSSRFIPTLIKALLEKKSIKLTLGKQRHDFIYIEDVMDIYIKAMGKGKKLSGQILNMGTGKEYTNGEIVKMLFKISEKKVQVKKGAFPKRLWDTKHWVADISKTKRLLNWKPRFTLEEGLRYTYFWFKNGRFQY